MKTLIAVVNVIICSVCAVSLWIYSVDIVLTAVRYNRKPFMHLRIEAKLRKPTFIIAIIAMIGVISCILWSLIFIDPVIALSEIIAIAAVSIVILIVHCCAYVLLTK